MTTPITDQLHSIADYIRYATSQFTKAQLGFHQGFDAALDEASFLVLHALHLPHDMPPAYAQALLLPEEKAALMGKIARRLAGEPLAYVTGEAWFAGLAFEVNPNVLIPRSPIAELIEQGFAPWLEDAPARILDLCTGSGCIAIALAAHFQDARVDAADISTEAVAVAERNAKAHGVEDRVSAVQSDLFGALKGRKYDLIVSNPPYVSEAEMRALPKEFNHEPALALVSGFDGLDAPLAILDEAPSYLTPNGVLVLEVGASESALMALLPDFPGEWVDFSRGGSGVAVIRQKDLKSYRPMISRALAQRAEDS